MPFAAALSQASPSLQALDEVCSTIGSFFSEAPGLVLAFFSPHHLPAVRELAEGLQQRLKPACLLGCVGETIIGNEREVEMGPALSVWAGRWVRRVEMTPFHLVLERTSEGASLLGWPDALVGPQAKDTAVLLLGDPFSFPIDLFLRQINEDAPGLPVLGGMASGVRGPGQCRFIFGTQMRDQGAVGVLLQGALGLRSIVSQGCRPVGRPLVITKAEDNCILELGGRPPLEQLRELWVSLSPQDQRLMQQGLHIGRVINEYQDLFQRGDFLVRNVMQLDRQTGALYITDQVRVGQTVQFHVRDAVTADEDLHALLQLDLSAHDKKPGAALLFSCNGRGTRLFSLPDHDASVIRTEAGPVPLAGFFAQGELGPVGGQNFIHGFTASVALFEE
jgi:small ligand-binding sensory domain FIST